MGSAIRGAAGNFFWIAAGAVTGAAPNVEAAADPTGCSDLVDGSMMGIHQRYSSHSIEDL